MEIIQQILINATSDGFFNFLGYFILIALPIQLPIFIINRIFRHFSLIKLGYPPIHCNADGDLVEIKDGEDE